MKSVLKSLTVTSLVLSGGFLFGFSEQTSAASLQSDKAEVSTEKKNIASYEFSFYDLSDLRGTLFFTLLPGSSKSSVGNDDISSIEMPPSSYVILYSDFDYEGRKIRIENTSTSRYKTVNLSDYYFDGSNLKCNNNVGSLKTGKL